MMIATVDQIHKTKAEALNQIAASNAEMGSFLRMPADSATALDFARLRAEHLRQLKIKNDILRGLVELCDALIRERGEC